MEKLRRDYPVGALAEAIEVSKSGFAAHGQKPRPPRHQRDLELRALITASFARSRQIDGCRRVRADLASAGQRCGKARIARLLRQERLRPRQKRRFRP
jgi:transposase InsO family protein